MPITNERQQTRMEVLDWNKEEDCPNRAQINPEIEKWEIATGAELAKSCFKAPEPRSAPSPGSTRRSEAEAEAQAVHLPRGVCQAAARHHVQDQRGGRAAARALLPHGGHGG